MTVSDALYTLYDSEPVDTNEVARLITGTKNPEALKKEAEADGWRPVYFTANGSDLVLYYTTPWNRRMLFKKHRIIGMKDNAPIFHKEQ